MRRRLFSLLCVMALCATLFLPGHADTSICFTAVNDRLLTLTADTMPVWSEGQLYVPHSVFDVNTTGAFLGTSSTYNRSSGVVAIFNLHQMMVFDLNDGTCRNDRTGEILNGRAIVRNGTAYVPVASVCSFFNLSHSYLHSEHGYLARIIRPGYAYLSDRDFVDAGSNLMRNRLKAYHQSLAPSTPPTTPSTPSTPDTPAPQPETTAVPTYLAVRCETGQAALPIAQALEESRMFGLFFFPAQEIGRSGPLIRRLMGHGHSVGILAEGETQSETERLLTLGADALRTAARSRTYFALVPEDHRAALADQGWVFWNSTADATPDGSRSPYAHAMNLVHSLPKRGTVQLTLDDSQLSADAIGNVLRQLENRHYTVTIPRETHL